MRQKMTRWLIYLVGTLIAVLLTGRVIALVNRLWKQKMRCCRA